MSLINTVTGKKQLYTLSQNSEGLTVHVGEDMVVVGVAQWETTRKATGECVCTGFVLQDGRCITTLSPTVADCIQTLEQFVGAPTADNPLTLRAEYRKSNNKNEFLTLVLV
jgi:hypothetical protein